MEKIVSLSLLSEGTGEVKTYNLSEKSDFLSVLNAMFSTSVEGENIGLIWDNEHGFTDDYEDEFRLLDEFLDWEKGTGPCLFMFCVSRPLTLVDWKGNALSKTRIILQGSGYGFGYWYKKHNISTFNLRPQYYYVFNTKRGTLTELHGSDAVNFLAVCESTASAERHVYRMKSSVKNFSSAYKLDPRNQGLNF